MTHIFRSKETGQALPLGIAFLMSTILLGLVLFNTGQTASEKSRLVNTADAAAYSGLIWQAR
ncbi:MAG: pilus assembly protein TadG-related protein, partial [Candidatus Thiodiazotropha endolucinida]